MLHLKVKRDLNELTKEVENFNDFLILENYLDQCVKLRLTENEQNLKEAHDVSTIITSKYQGRVLFKGIYIFLFISSSF